ncbi:MAG TPA: VF530 family protein [Desulfuromonadaceae bacterium]
MSEQNNNDPLHGVTLKLILEQLSAEFGWEGMGKVIPVRCFTHDPSIVSSLKFLRQTPWARDKVEEMYLRWKIGQMP